MLIYQLAEYRSAERKYVRFAAGTAQYCETGRQIKNKASSSPTKASATQTATPFRRRLWITLFPELVSGQSSVQQKSFNCTYVIRAYNASIAAFIDQMVSNIACSDANTHFDPTTRDSIDSGVKASISSGVRRFDPAPVTIWLNAMHSMVYQTPPNATM